MFKWIFKTLGNSFKRRGLRVILMLLRDTIDDLLEEGKTNGRVKE